MSVFIAGPAFSILERIDVGETGMFVLVMVVATSLSVSSNGSTWVKLCEVRWNGTTRCSFSILERIDVGETGGTALVDLVLRDFQYPRTDRRG